MANPPQENARGVQALTLYEASSAAMQTKAERQAKLGRIRLPELGGLENFSVKAKMQWNTQPQQLVAEAQNFTFPATFSGELHGWRGRDSQYLWRGQPGRQVPLQLKLTPLAAAQAFKPSDYDELWIDYTRTMGVPQCAPQLELRGQRQPYDKKEPAEAVVWRRSDLKALLRLDATQSAWKEKDYFYLLGRMVGQAPDADWRYAQDQNTTVVQRRMHFKLDMVQMLEIAFAPGYSAERVNLLVSRRDSQGGGELLEFTGLSPNATLPDGEAGVRLDLAAELARRFPDAWTENVKKPGTHHFYLQEVILFMPGEQATVVAAKPVRSLVLSGSTEREQRQEQALHSQVIGVNAHEQRMVVDLRSIGERRRFDLTQMTMELVPPIGAASCALRINGVRAVSVYNGQVPIFAQVAEDWSHRWRGAFERQLPEQGQVEQPGIIAFLPLATLSWADTEKSAFNKNLLDPTQDNRLEFRPMTTGGHVPGYRVLGADGQQMTMSGQHLVSNGGAILTATGPMPGTRQEGDALVVESGQIDIGAGQIKITWPVSAQLPDKAWFYWGVAEGAENIGQAVLTVELAGGRKLLLRTGPNQPVRLPSGTDRVAGVQLTFEPLVYPYRIKLRELALFAPAAVSYGEARALRLPMPYDARPLPTREGDGALLEARPGFVSGWVGDDPVRFVTPLEQEMAWVRGLRLTFHLPNGSVGGDCPIALKLNWAHGQTQRQICPAESNDRLFIPFVNLLGAEGQGHDLGALHSIEWMVQGLAASGRQEVFSLDFTVEGWAMLSALDQLRLSPLFHARGETVRADFAQIGSFNPEQYVQRFWLPLEASALDKMARAGGDVLPITHPLFSLERIVAEPKQPIDSRLWQDFNNPPPPETPPRWPKWLIWVVSIATLAWGAARKGWWSPGRAWLYAKGLAYLMYWLVAQGVIRLSKGLWRYRSWGNVLIGVMAMGPGFWYAGSQADAYAGLMWLLLASLLAWGAYRHWRKWAEPAYAQAVAVLEGMQTERLFLAIALGNAIWALGHFGMTTRALLGALPLLGMVYLYLPRIYRFGLVWELHLPGLWRWLGWMATVVALYGLGLALKVESGENYFFTFGGMVAVLALRAALLLTEPWLRRLVPSLAEAVFGGAGSLYFTGALAMLVGTAIMLSFKLEPIAEQFAIVLYYCLVVGTAQAIIALRRERQPDQETQSS